MADTRTITVWESQQDLKELRRSGYNFQIAKSVLTEPGQPAKFNTVWKSKDTVPSSTVGWDAVYALNWTAHFPGVNWSVTVGGSWRVVAKGQKIILSSSGFFDDPTSGGVDGFLTVERVDYSYPGIPGIHLVVGVKNAEGRFDTIFVNPVSTSEGGSAKFSPVDTVQCWYEAGNKTGTIISDNRTGVLEMDCTNPTPSRNQFQWWISYKVADSSWMKSETPVQQPPRQTADSESNGTAGSFDLDVQRAIDSLRANE